MRVAIVAAGVLLAAPLAAQNGAPPRTLALSTTASARHLRVATSATAASVKAGGLVSLYVDVAPNQGIHVYAPGAKDYLPIAVKLDPHPNVKAGKLIYPKSVSLFADPLSVVVPGYREPFRLTQDVTITALPKAGATMTLTGTVAYQACDDKVCFVPESVPVSWTVDVK